MLPKVIKTACIVGSIVLVIQAIMLPFYQTDGSSSSIMGQFIYAGTAFVFILFSLRKSWTWILTLGLASAFLISSILVFPTEQYYGALTPVAQVTSFLQGLSCFVILVSVLLPAGRRWFFGPYQFAAVSDELFTAIRQNETTAEVTYQLSQFDLLWFNLYQSVRSLTLLVALMVTMLGVGYFVFIVFSETSVSLSVKIITYVFVLAILLLTMAILNFVILVIFHLINQIRDPRVTLLMSDEGLIIASASERREIKWSGIKQVRQRGGHILFFLSGRSAIVVPTHAFSNDTDAGNFFVYARQLWEKAVHPMTAE